MSSKKKSAKSLTKSQVLSEIAGRVGLTKSQVNDVFDSLSALVREELKGNRPLTIPGIVKVSLTRKPATPARPGRNPFTGADITIKAKPARNVVKVRAVKALKEMA